MLAVRLNGRLVGTLTRLIDETIIFAFDPEYTDDPDRPVLSMSFKGPGGNLVLDRTQTGTRLLPFFSNLLPEGHLREYLARRLEIKTEREFYLLAGLGEDLPGALTVEPVGELAANADARHVERAIESEKVLRFSLAGVQLKFSAIAESRGGFTIPASGVGGSWIVKLSSHGFSQVPETEFSMLTLARRIGIDVPEFELVPGNSIAGLPEEFVDDEGALSLAIKRFDRSASGRIHMEDFAQVYGVYPDKKYEQAGYGHVARVIWWECGSESYKEFVRRLVFSVVFGNGDMHLKNWSLLYQDPRKPTLSPAYDFVPTVAYMGENETLGLNLGGTKDFRDVTLGKFMKVSRFAEAPEAVTESVVKETISHIHEVWENGEVDLPLPKEIRKRINMHMAKLPLLKAPPAIL